MTIIRSLSSYRAERASATPTDASLSLGTTPAATGAGQETQTIIQVLASAQQRREDQDLVRAVQQRTGEDSSSEDRLGEVRRRLAAGYYTQPEVLDRMSACLAHVLRDDAL